MCAIAPRRNAKIVKLLRAPELTMDVIGDMFGLCRGTSLISMVSQLAAHGRHRLLHRQT